MVILFKAILQHAVSLITSCFFLYILNVTFVKKKKAEHVSYSRIIDILSISLIFFIWSFLPSDITAFLTQIVVNKFLKVKFNLCLF